VGCCRRGINFKWGSALLAWSARSDDLGRVTDNFKTINETLHKVDKCIDELYEGRNRTNERVTRLEAKVERSLNGTKTTRRENNG